jgi:hypothetical protein
VTRFSAPTGILGGVHEVVDTRIKGFGVRLDPRDGPLDLRLLADRAPRLLTALGKLGVGGLGQGSPVMNQTPPERVRRKVCFSKVSDPLWSPEGIAASMSTRAVSPVTCASRRTTRMPSGRYARSRTATEQGLAAARNRAAWSWSPSITPAR